MVPTKIYIRDSLLCNGTVLIREGTVTVTCPRESLSMSRYSGTPKEFRDFEGCVTRYSRIERNSTVCTTKNLVHYI